MEVFTIVANEVIGLSATECTLIQFSYNPEQIRDPESVLRSAVKDYLKTDEGKRQLEINCGCRNWGDVDDIPGSFFLNYGLAKIAPPDMKKMRIYSANNVFIEVTRRCNMCCAHCLRGDAESIDIQEKYIDAFLDNFEKGAYISSLTFTGGEISLNIPAIRYTLKAVKERGIAVGSFYMVTNGKAVDKMADLAMASLEWWAYCDEKDDYMCGLCISSDNFHEVIPYESKSILSGLKYNRNDKVTDFHLAYLLNEGRAKNLDSNIYKKREPHVDKLEYEFNKTGDIDFYSGELYLNAIGDVVSGCDWSYKSQKKYRFGNVMNKNWLENISNSELYIAS